jgi:nucleotide-binding universal stress UspA family protein
MSHQELLMAQGGKQQLEARSSVASSIKTILLHVLDDEFHDQRIECALSLARACSSHLSCLHITPIEAYVAFDKFGGIFVMNDVMNKIDQRDTELKSKIEKRLAREDVSWDYHQATASVAATLLGRAALADLVISAREPPHHDYLAPTIGFLGELIDRSRTPLFVPSFPQESFDPAGTAIIAWDGSLEAANAVRSALGLLCLSSDVRVIQVREERADDRKIFPTTDVLEYLSRHGIHAQLNVVDAPARHPNQEVVSGMIVAEALGSGAGYIVMGGYSHARIAEYVFGGVTRTLLKECPVALVIAH